MTNYYICKNCFEEKHRKNMPPYIGKFCSTACLYEYEDSITDDDHIEDIFEEMVKPKRK